MARMSRNGLLLTASEFEFDPCRNRRRLPCRFPLTGVKHRWCLRSRITCAHNGVCPVLGRDRFDRQIAAAQVLDEIAFDAAQAGGAYSAVLWSPSPPWPPDREKIWAKQVVI